MTAVSRNLDVTLFDALGRSSNLPEGAFSEPWMARAFGLVLALTEARLFSLKEFQAALIQSVGDQERSRCLENEADYYTCWLRALTSLLGSRGILTEEGLAVTERSVVAEAAARRTHQHASFRNADGSLRIAPITVA
jgi:nitrile hydratase accessory protein